MFSPRNIIEARVDSIDELGSTLERLSSGGFRTVVYLDMGGLHAVGVTQFRYGLYDVRSTWTPFDDEAVTLSELYDYLDRAPRLRRKDTNSHNTHKAMNIIALPPETKH